MRRSQWSSSPRSTVYPIEPGHIFRLRNSFTIYNKQVGAELEHTVFIWVRRCGRILKRRQPKDRHIATARVYVPAPSQFHKPENVIVRDRIIQQDSLILQLRRHGWSLLRDEEGEPVVVKCHYTQAADAAFYQAIGVTV